jgi:type IV secretory pathway TrbF-like protein
LLLSLILASGFVWLANHSRYIPYVVEVDKLGYALTAPQPLTPVDLPDVTTRMERYEVAAFIRDARSVTSDTRVEHQMLNGLLAHTRGAADRFLDEYYHSDNFSHNPFKIAEKQTVSVEEWFDLAPPKGGIESGCQAEAHSSVRALGVRWRRAVHTVGIARAALLSF